MRKIFCLLGLLLGSAEVSAGWVQEDVGTVGVAGTASYNSGTGVHTINGAGVGAQGTSDALTYVYQAMNGDCEIIARLDSVGSGAPQTQAGLMMRENLDANGRNAFVYGTGQDGVDFSARVAVGNSSLMTSGPTTSGAVWLRLVRVGNGVFGYTSSDGTGWTLVGSQTVQMGSTYYVGFAVASAVGGTLTEAKFSGSSVVGSLPNGISGLKVWLRADQGVTQSGGAVSQWNDLSGNSNNSSQVTSGNQPAVVASALNGKPVVRFSSTGNKYLSIPNAASLNGAGLTIVGVVKRTSGTGTAVIAQKWTTPNPQYAFQIMDATTPRLYVNGANYATGMLPSGTVGVLAATCDSSAVKVYVNGALSQSSSYTGGMITGSGPLTIGGIAGGASLDGDIAELLVFDRAISNAERHEIEAYFYQRYGVGTQPALSALSLSGGQPSGIYGTAQTASVAVPSGTSVYYTTDGSDPTQESTLYTGPVTVSSSATLKFKAFKNGYIPSATLSASYVIDTQAAFTRSGLVSWLRADQGVTQSGGAVSQWNDLSGTGNHAVQTTSGNRPSIVVSALNGKPTVRFSSTGNKYLSIPNAASLNGSGLTIMTVVNRTGGAGTALLIDKWVGGTPSQYTLQMSTLVSPRLYVNNANYVAAGTLASGSYGIVGTTYDQSKIEMYVNTALSQSTPYVATLASGTSPVYVGGYNGSMSLDGDIAELLIFNRALGEVERKEVESYLYQRYGVGSAPSLPALSLNGGQPSGIYGTAQTANVAVPSGTSVYYTTDGSDPTQESTLYTGPVTVSSSATLKFKAFKNGYSPSATLSASYVIDSQATFTRSGLVSWLRADQGVTQSGGTVSQWSDLSGSGNHAVQATSGNRPALVSNVLNGKPAMRFSLVGHKYLSIPSAASLNGAGLTIVAVANRTAGTSPAILAQKWTTTASAQYAFHMGTATSPKFYVNNLANGTAGTLSSGSYGALIGTYDQNKVELYVNGSLSQSTAYVGAVASGSDPVWIGGCGTDSNLDGDMAEVMIFNRALSEAERKDVESYLYYRYGLGSPSVPALSFNGGQAGGVYTEAQTVSVSVPSGANVYFTTNGSEPTEASTLYTGPVMVSSSSTIKFKAFKSGYSPSATLSASYVIDSQAAFTRSGLVAWLRADQGVTQSGGAVSQWNDLSGNSNNSSQVTSGNQPAVVASALNGKPVVRFSSTGNKYLSIPNAASLNGGGLTIVGVIKRTSGTGTAVIAQKWTTPNPQYAFQIIDATTPRLYVNGSNYATGMLPSGTVGVLAATCDSSAVKVYVNGALSQSSSYTGGMITGSGPLTIGGVAGGASLDGDIAELLVFDRAISNAERHEIEAYFYQRYGVGTQPALSALSFNGGQAGGVYTEAQTVSVSVPNGANVYYTMNGSEPTQASTLYTGPLSVSSSATLNFKAFKNGYSPSATLSASYVIDSQAAFTRSGLVSWLRADQGVTQSGGAVSQWNDLSGSGNHAIQATSGNRPSVVNSVLNGKPVVRFSTTGNKYLSIPNAASLNGSALTIVAVVNRTSGSAPGVIAQKWVGSPTQYALQIHDGTTPRIYVNGGTTHASGGLASGTYGTLVATYDQSKIEMYVNGTLGQSTLFSGSLVSGTSPVWIGGYNGVGHNLDGDIAELLIFNRALSEAERKDVESYIYYRYRVGNGNFSPTASLTVGTFGLAPAIIPLSAVASDEDGTVSRVDFYNGTQLLASTNSPYTYNWTSVGPGTYQLKAFAYDDKGAESPVSAQTVVVNNPQVSISNIYSSIWESSSVPGKMKLTVENGNLTVPLVVPLSFSGTATAGADYETPAATAEISPSTNMLELEFQPIVDGVTEGDETLIASLGSSSSFAVGSSANSTLTITETAFVPAPTFDPGSSRGIVNFGVTINSAMPWAMIRYTMSGLPPETSSQLIEAGGVVTVERNLTLKAQALDPDGNTSAVTTAYYQVTGIATGSGSAYHALGLKSNGQVLAWGRQTNGVLGNGLLTTANQTTPIQVMKNATTPFLNGVEVAVGNNHSLILDDLGAVWTFGDNASGQLGNNAAPTDSAYPVLVLKQASPSVALDQVVQVSGGSSFSLALDANGGVWSWGVKTNGRLGDGTNSGTRAIAGRVQKNVTDYPDLDGIARISSSHAHSLAVDGSGRVWGWGVNASGQMGIGNLTTDQLRAVKTQVSAVGGDFLNVVEAMAAAEHSLFLKDDGSVWACGLQTNGRLGNNALTAANQSYPVQVLQTDGSGTSALSDVVQIAVGPLHNLALKADGTVWSWGGNNNAQLGLGHTTDQATAVQLPGLDNVVCIGTGGDGLVAGSGNWSFAIKGDGTLYSWGDNANGQLADGTLNPHTSPSAAAAGHQFSNGAAADSDADGIADWWELEQFGNLTQGSSSDFDGDGLTNLQEYEQTSDPKNFYNQGAAMIIPGIQIVSGNNQEGQPETFLAQPLVVKVVDAVTSAPLINAPVTFTVTAGGGQLATTNVGAPALSSSKTIRTGLNGEANLYYFQPTGTNVSSQITAVTESASVEFTATTLTTSMVLVGGNQQFGQVDSYVFEPLTVQVINQSNNSPISGVTVTFSVPNGPGSLAAAANSPTTSASIDLTTDSNGVAQAYHQLGTTPLAAHQVNVQTTGAQPLGFTSTTVAEDGRLAQWEFNEKTGVTAEESVSLSNDGTLTNSVLWSDGFDGKGAVSFSGSQSEGGTDAYVTMGNPANGSLDLGRDSFTVASWVRFSEASLPSGVTERRIVGKGNLAGESGYFLGVLADGKLVAGIGSDAASSPVAETVRIETVAAFNDGRWHHVALTFDAVEGKVRLWVDGIAQALTQGSGTGGELVIPEELTVTSLEHLNASALTTAFFAGGAPTTSAYFKGELDDLRIYRKALNEAEALELFNVDSDSSGLPDVLEYEAFGQLGVDPNGDLDGDGWSNLDELIYGSDPTDFYSQVWYTIYPMLAAASAVHLEGIPGEYLPETFAVVMTDPSWGYPMGGMPVTFKVTSGGGLLSEENSSEAVTSTTITVLTGWDGVARIYYRQPSGVDVDSTIEAKASTETVEFTAKTIEPALVLAGGDQQFGTPSVELSEALVVRVTNASSEAPISGTPVTFTLTGGGGLSSTSGGTAESEVVVTSGVDGLARVYLKLGATPLSAVTVNAEMGGGVPAVEFAATATAADGRVAHWNLNEKTGTVAAEQVTLSANGTLTNSPQWLDGIEGNGSLVFSGAQTEGGTDAHVTMGDPVNGSLDFGRGSFALAAWVRFTEDSIPVGATERRIVGKGDPSTGGGYFLGVVEGGKLVAAIGSDADSHPLNQTMRIKTVKSFNDGQWHHVILNRNALTQMVEILVDGVAQPSIKEAGTGGAYVSSTALSVSSLSNLQTTSAAAFTVASDSGTDDFFKGEVDDVRIYRKALTVTEAGELFELDSDANDLPDFWEYANFGDLGNNPNLDADGDGLSNLTEYLTGTDPNDYYSQGGTTVLAAIEATGALHQNGVPGVFLGSALEVKVSNAATGDPLENAPVVFTVSSGGGELAFTGVGAPVVYSTLTAYTDENGLARAYYLQSSAEGVTSEIEARVSSLAAVEFTAETGVTGDMDNDGLPDAWEITHFGNLSAEPTADSDEDGLSNLEEFQNGSDPNSTDSDGDTLPDAYEVANGLDPAVNDAWSDLDGDRWPNIIEYKHGTKVAQAGQAPDPLNEVTTPPPVYEVDAGLAADDVPNRKYQTIQGAVNAAKAMEVVESVNTYPNRFAVIWVKRGVYTEAVTIETTEMVLLGEEAGGSLLPVIEANPSTVEYALQMKSPSLVDGFVITHASGSEGGGVYTHAGSTAKDRVLVNTIIRGNAGNEFGGAIHNAGADLQVIHSTLAGNSAEEEGNGIYNASGTVSVVNSIVWNVGGTAGEEIAATTPANVTVDHSIVQGGEFGATSTNPQLTVLGMLSGSSAAVDAGRTDLFILMDIQGEVRPTGTAPDLGADEFEDVDSDGMADWWEREKFGDLEADPTEDPDEDGINNLLEYQQNTEPVDLDVDDDGLILPDEVSSGTNVQKKDNPAVGLRVNVIVR